MNKKVTKIIILIVLFIILTGVAGYLILIKKPTLEKVRSYNLKFNRDSIEYLSLYLSGDGKYGSIVFQNIKDKKYYIQINNQTYGPYDDVGDLKFSNDGPKYGWSFKKDNKYYIQINNQTYGPYDKFDKFEEYLQFSNDLSKYGWKFAKNGKLYIQINNQTYGPYDQVVYPYLRFSNDSSKYGWWFGKNNKYYIQLNNQTYGPYDKANFTFTKDNKVYIIYVKDNKMIIERID